jgi:protein-tyrosine phosphatase
MIRIVDGLYLGNREAARDLTRLRQLRITHVVNCTEELPNYHEGHFTYLGLGLRDPDPNLHRHLARACSFIDEARQADGRVLVHCFAAVSRSPSIVLSYLCHLGTSLERAAEQLADAVWTDPDLIFLEQIARHFKQASDEDEIRRISNILVGRRGY